MAFTVYSEGTALAAFDYLDTAGSWAYGNCCGAWSVKDDQGTVRLTNETYKALRPLTPPIVDPLTGKRVTADRSSNPPPSMPPSKAEVPAAEKASSPRRRARLR